MRTKKRREPLFSQVVYYVCSDVKAAFSYFLLNTVIVGIAAAYLLAFGYVAVVVNIETRKFVDQPGVGTKIKAICAESAMTDERGRFTAAKIKELQAGEPKIKVAYELIQLGVNLSVNGRSPVPYFPEGITVDDPQLEPRNLCSGRGISANNAEEIILTNQALVQLRGRESGKQAPGAKIPEFVAVSLARKVKDQLQPLAKEYRLVGVLDSNQPAAYLPLEQIRQLENWAANYITDLVVDGQTSRPLDLIIDAARVFIDSAVPSARVEEAKNYYDLKLEPFTSYDEYSAKTAPQIRVSPGLGADFSLAALPQPVRERKDLKFQIVSIADLNLGGGRETLVVLALSPTDFRLRDIVVSGQSPAQEIIRQLGHVVISNQYAESLGTNEQECGKRIIFSDQALTYSLVFDGLTGSLLGGCYFDILCSLETLGYMKYQPEIETACLVAVNNPAAINALKHQASRIWEELPKELLNQEIVAVQANGATQLEGIEPLADGSAVLPEAKDPAVNQISHLSSMIKEKLKQVIDSGSVVIYGQKGEGGVFDPNQRRAVALIKGEKVGLGAVWKKIPDQELKVAEIYLLPKAKFSHFGSAVKAAFTSPEEMALLPFDWAKQYAILDPPDVLVSKGCPFNSAVSLGGIKLTPLKAKDEPFPEELAFVNYQALDKLPLWESFNQAERQDRLQGLEKKVDIIFSEVKSYPQVIEQLTGAGLMVENLNQVEVRPIVGYQAKSAKEKDGRISKKTLALLQSNKVFFDVCPDFRIPARISDLDLPPEKAKVNFAASHQNDPLKNCVPLKAGDWLADDKRNLIVIPETVLAAYAFKPGDGIRLIFEKENEPPITWECFISGIAAGDWGYLNSELAADIYFWLTGQLVYSERLGKFLQPGNIPQTAGYAAANIYVGSLAEVKPVVGYLQKLGYRTEDSLKAQADLMKLKQILAFLVVILAIGSCASAMAEVIFTTLMNTKTKIYETAGILRALGAGQKLIKRIFILKGAAMGVLAFVLAVIFAAAGLAVVKFCLVKLSLGEKVAQLDEYPFFSADTYWLFAAVFGFTLVVCLIGVRWSVRLAGRTEIAKALRSRE